MAACSTSTNEPPNEVTRQRLTSQEAAHEVKETHPATAMYFVGFLTLIVIDVVS